jgi:hypothetical protein
MCQDVNQTGGEGRDSMASESEQSRTGRQASGVFRYALVDLASAVPLRPVIPRLRSAIAEPLFARSQPLQLLEVGPWLVDLAEAPEVAATIAGFGADIPWGYYLHSKVDMISLRQSLRKFNLAQLAGSKKEMLFRYWDPRVIRIFLDGATPVQRARFLEWIDRIEWADGTVREKATAAEFGR